MTSVRKFRSTGVSPSSPNVERREKLRLLTKSWPEWLDAPIQEFITWMTGKPYSKQESLFRSTPERELLTALVWFFGGGAAGFMIVNAGPWFWALLPLAWLFVVGGARYLVLGPSHYCMHNSFSKNHRVNFLVGESISVVSWTQDYESYKDDHLKSHHPPDKLATLEYDPDKQLIVRELGFVPGKPKDFYWKRLWATLLSPRVHLLLLSRRLKSNFLTASVYHRLLVLAWSGTVLSVVAVTHEWVSFLLAWVIPISVGYQVSALLQFLGGEHLWGNECSGEPVKLMLLRKCLGRFLGSAPPESSFLHQPCSWLTWGLKMLGHLAIRVSVLPADLPCHDMHHYGGNGSQDWPNAVYQRQKLVDAEYPGWPEPWPEVWGIWNAVDLVFASLSEAPSLSETPSLSKAPALKA